MLRILNKIKRRLLQNGRIERFLLFTVGEILLIVTGLLIALQINTWNGNRQEEHELKGYLQKIAENVSLDLQLADSLKNHRRRIKSISEEGLSILLSDSGKTTEYLVRSIVLFADFEFVSKKGGFESLISSGYLSKLNQSKVDSLLFQYYTLIDDLIREEQSFNGYVEFMETTLAATSPLVEAYGSGLGYPVDQEKASLAARQVFDQPPFQSALLRGAAQNAIFRKYEAVIQTGQLLTSAISNRLKD